MTIPSGGFSSTPQPAGLLEPDDRDRANLLEDLERGGIALNDASQGYNVRNWRAFSDGASIWVAPYPEGMPATLVYSGTDISEVALSFDQLMAPTVAFIDGGVCKLRWYDSTVPGWVVTSFPGYRSPMLTLDDKRGIANATNDIIFAYLRTGQVYYRQQRDRFAVEYSLGAAPSANSRILKLGMGKNWRLQVSLAAVPAMHADLSADRLYLAGADLLIRPLGEGAALAGRWLSPVLVTDDQPTMGWVRVEASSYPVRLRIWGDGRLVASRQIPSEQPARLPAIRAREWQLEIYGVNRVQQVRLASTWAELEGDDADLSV